MVSRWETYSALRTLTAAPTRMTRTDGELCSPDEIKGIAARERACHILLLIAGHTSRLIVKRHSPQTKESNASSKRRDPLTKCAHVCENLPPFIVQRVEPATRTTRLKTATILAAFPSLIPPAHAASRFVVSAPSSLISPPQSSTMRSYKDDYCRGC